MGLFAVSTGGFVSMMKTEVRAVLESEINGSDSNGCVGSSNEL